MGVFHALSVKVTLVTALRSDRRSAKLGRNHWRVQAIEVLVNIADPIGMDIAPDDQRVGHSVIDQRIGQSPTRRRITVPTVCPESLARPRHRIGF